MFWKCNIAVSAIDQIFEKETQPTLEELLEESEIIQELKSQNDKLISFITREENIKKIIEYLVDNEHPPFSKIILIT
ncbi:hypothetical protein HZS_1230 [Henneguya salminicola]|nr:hypothetical protein HZS_1230 [Henneguya salminicola]